MEHSTLLPMIRLSPSARDPGATSTDRPFRRAGYVATGFWAGITLGRAISTPLNNFVGEKRVIFLYLALAICLEVRCCLGSFSKL